MRTKQLSTTEEEFIATIDRLLDEGWTWKQIAKKKCSSESSIRNSYMRIDYRRVKLLLTVVERERDVCRLALYLSDYILETIRALSVVNMEMSGNHTYHVGHPMWKEMIALYGAQITEKTLMDYRKFIASYLIDNPTHPAWEKLKKLGVEIGK